MHPKGYRRTATAVALLLVVALAAGAALAARNDGDRSQEVKRAIEGGKAKNVIFFLGDGMDDSSITISRNYLRGAAGQFAGIDALPLTGQMTTYSVQENGKPDYDPDSASTGTAWSTGFKTSDRRISTAPGTGEDLTTILELAQKAGYATGNVTTARLTDATPAVLDSHVGFRSCEGPLDMAPCPEDKKSAGGPGSIAEQSVDHGVDVLLGGGDDKFGQPIDGGPYAGQTVTQSAIAQGYAVVKSRADLLAFNGDKKLLGLFTPGHMNLEFTGLPATNPPSGPQRCLENQRPANEPSLDEMTAKALDLLDKAKGEQGKGQAKGKQGFFLQVESASIDKQEHAANPCGHIGETLNFDRAIQVGRAYAAKHPDTLVIVTADHAHTPLIVENTSTPPGISSRLTTADGEIMQVTYGTSPAGSSQQHAGGQLRVAAQGPQAANVVGLIDQTDLFHIMARAIGAE